MNKFLVLILLGLINIAKGRGRSKSRSKHKGTTNDCESADPEPFDADWCHRHDNTQFTDTTDYWCETNCVTVDWCNEDFWTHDACQFVNVPGHDTFHDESTHCYCVVPPEILSLLG